MTAHFEPTYRAHDIGGSHLVFISDQQMNLYDGSATTASIADCGYLALSYHIEQTRLQLWGELCKPEYLKTMIVRILGEIQKLDDEANKLIFKYNIDLVKFTGA
jgi:hypothetical protein